MAPTGLGAGAEPERETEAEAQVPPVSGAVAEKEVAGLVPEEHKLEADVEIELEA